MQLSQTATLDFIRNRILLGTLSLSKNWHFHKKSSFSRKRESSVFNIFWIPRSNRRMTSTEFLDRLHIPYFSYSLTNNNSLPKPARIIAILIFRHNYKLVGLKVANNAILLRS
mgnify:CR=1 FL=1